MTAAKSPKKVEKQSLVKSPIIYALEKKQRLLRLVDAYLKLHPDRSYGLFSVEALKKEMLTNDESEIKITLEQIKERLKKAFEYSSFDREEREMMVSGDYVYTVFDGVKITIHDRVRLEKYLAEINRSIEQSPKSKTYNFLLYSDGWLALVGDGNKAYQMRTNMLPYKLLYCIGSAGGKPVSTQYLGRIVELTTSGVRRKLEKLKTEVEQKLGVPRDALIKNVGGYCTPTLSLESRGYTP